MQQNEIGTVRVKSTEAVDRMAQTHEERVSAGARKRVACRVVWCRADTKLQDYVMRAWIVEYGAEL